MTIPPERRDSKLTEKLLKERDGILAWAVEGCLRWQQQGLKPPSSVVSATEDYFEAEDALRQWLEERCEQNTQAKVATSDLYADWREWAERAGEYVGSIKRFVENLQTRGFERTRLHGGVRAISGLMTRPKPFYRNFHDPME